MGVKLGLLFEDHKRRSNEKRVQKRMLEPKRIKVTSRCRKFHTEEF